MTSLVGRNGAAQPVSGPHTSGSTVPEVVARLRATFATDRTRALSWRRRQLDALDRLLTTHEREIVEALDADLGRTAFEAWLADIASIRAEIRFARSRLGRWAKDRRTGLPKATLPAWGRIRREPLGVVLVIGAWNYPFYLTLGPLVGAVAAGNAVVLKPSEHAPASSALMARLVGEYLDTSAITVVEGAVDETQALLAQGLDHVLYTGSAAVGAKILEAAAPTLTPVTLELGGKCPVVVTADADLEVAARRIVWAKLTNAGQTCITPDYVLVEAGVKDELVRRLVETVEEFRKDAPAAQRIVNRRQYDRLAGLLDSHGGTVAYGGSVDEAAVAVQPTIIVDPDITSPLMADEIFGPILPVLAVDSLDDAIGFVRARPKPLAAYLFSGSGAEHKRFVDKVSAGGVVINHIGLHCLSPQVPFGGVGHSGTGAYHGRWGFETFSHRKPVVRTYTRPDPPFLYPPMTSLKNAVLRRMM
ncbi:aldehyde dehydrogenase family protein [Pseudonocardia xishanensis]|uniref:Aldehyde dehydrogenase n=1 Tax=Pseudonocardia xishanensis TaxID=630995 RepID=A0ABP8RTE5_9PSEU